MTKTLDTFTESYIECALWSSVGPDEDGDYGRPLDEDYDESDLSAECLAAIVEDCTAFQADNAAHLALAGDEGQNGHDFWLTRNGHGAGFWDRGYGPVGDHLSAAAKVYGSVDLYVGDDGKVHGQ